VLTKQIKSIKIAYRMQAIFLLLRNLICHVLYIAKHISLNIQNNRILICTVNALKLHFVQHLYLSNHLLTISRESILPINIWISVSLITCVPLTSAFNDDRHNLSKIHTKIRDNNTCLQDHYIIQIWPVEQDESGKCKPWQKHSIT